MKPKTSRPHDPLPAQLASLLSDAPPAPRDDFSVAAIYYPGFHPTPFMESWFGFDWSEWVLSEQCKPRFPGHRQPIRCLWGPFDESDPANAARETDAAADHGIDIWIYDWYWYSGIQIWNEALDRGYLNAPNRDRMKFAVMWANHTWNHNHPAPLVGPLPHLLPIRHSPEDFDRVIDHWCEHYFSQSNYWRIDGKPWCSIYRLASLLDNLGGTRGVARVLERMRRRAQTHGHPDLFICQFVNSPSDAALAARLGFDQVTTYNIVNGRNQQPAQPLVDYADVILQHIHQWLAIAAANPNYAPVVTQGWDVSARNHPHEPWPPVRWQWPWGHIVTGNSPQRFAQFITAARRFLSLHPSNPNTIFINAWNEWTEGSVLLPTRDEKWAVLKALRKALAP